MHNLLVIIATRGHRVLRFGVFLEVSLAPVSVERFRALDKVARPRTFLLVITRDVLVEIVRTSRALISGNAGRKNVSTVCGIDVDW